jgi:hypothetical protein
MADLVVTVPKSFGLDTWIDEGDPAGSEWSGQVWDFYLPPGTPWPPINPGDRVYVVYNNKLRGYAPLVRVAYERGSYSLIRHGGAVAVTIDEPIRGFRGWIERWWPREIEKDFSYPWVDGRPAWMVPGEVDIRASEKRGIRHVFYDDLLIGGIIREKLKLTCLQCRNRNAKNPDWQIFCTQVEGKLLDHIMKEHAPDHFEKYGQMVKSGEIKLPYCDTYRFSPYCHKPDRVHPSWVSVER